MGKRRRNGPLSDSNSGSDSEPDLPPSMDTDPQPTPASPTPPSDPYPANAHPGSDSRPPSDHARTTDLRSSSDLARSYDPRPSSDHALNLDTRPNSADAPASTTVVGSAEIHLSPTGSFLVVKACDDNVSFRKMNVFWPKKQIHAICGPVDVEIEAPANGTLIIKTNGRKYTKALLNTTTFCGKQVTVSLHNARNTCKGTIFAPELRHMTEEEILSDLRGDGVTHIRRITSFRDGQRRDTSLLVLTFDSTTLPEKLVIGWLRKDVRVFVPNPLRCYNCQRFGHGSTSCRQPARCQKCGEAPHEGSDCTSPKSCLNCGSADHLVSSSQCPVWKDEKQVCEVKAKTGLSYPEARRQVKAEKATPIPGRSYAKAASVQTASCGTQTEPLTALPPLQLLKPLTSQATTATTTTTTATTTETQVSTDDIADEPSSSPVNTQVDPVVVSPVVAQRPTAGAARCSPHGWTKVQTRPGNNRKPSNIDKQPEQPSDHSSRPPIRIAMGHSRSSSWASPGRGERPRNT